MDKFLIIANWKANLVEFTISNFQFPIPDTIDVAIAPQFPQISRVLEPFSRAAQDVSQFSGGAYTGEVTAETLKSFNVKYCLVGHSERRKYFGETTETVGQKVSNLLTAGILPIICARTLPDIPNIPDIPYVMYEPEEAISTSGNYHPEPPGKINQILAAWQHQFPGNAKFLYGGSLSANFPFSGLNFSLISGLVIGQASLDPNALKQICLKVSENL